MRRDLLVYVVLLILLSLHFSSISPSKGVTTHTYTTLEIVVPGNYSSIQEAIDNAPEGSTIRVKNGTYNEHLEIAFKSLNIYGSEEAPTILKNDWTGDAVLIDRANNVTFSGFQIEGAIGSFGHGIRITQCQHIQIFNNKVVGNEYGIYFWDSFNVTLRNNNITGNRWNFGIWGLLLTSHFLHDIDTSNIVNERPICYWINQKNKTVPSDFGYVALVNSSNIVVSNLNFSNNFQGILVVHSTNITVQNNSFEKNYYGIHMADVSNNNIITQNAFFNNNIGLMLDLSSRNRIEKNVFFKNQKGLTLSYSPLAPDLSCIENYICLNNFTQNYASITVLNATSNKFCGNQIISSTRYGILLTSGSCGNIFYGNTLLSNNDGLAIQRSNNNLIYNNNFINNTRHIYTEASTNKWNNTKNIGGNFWSNTTTSDTDLDGISDLPYEVDTLNVDSHPFAGRFYNYTFFWENQEFFLTLISNSSDLDFEFVPQQSKAVLNFSGSNQTIGFCRANLPKKLIQTFWYENLTILVNKEPPSSIRNWDDNSSVYLYFNVPHPISQVLIIPEFSSSLLLVIVLVFVFLFRKTTITRIIFNR